MKKNFPTRVTIELSDFQQKSFDYLREQQPESSDQELVGMALNQGTVFMVADQMKNGRSQGEEIPLVATASNRPFPAAHSGHRERVDRTNVTARIGDRDRSEATLLFRSGFCGELLLPS